jgi:ATP-dependent helicase/nuclease subunit B
MNIRLIRPEDGLIEAVVSEIRPTGKDYSRYWIVFPEKRPAFYLRRMLAAREGTGFIPPAVDSIDGFVDRVHSAKLGRKTRPMDVLDAVAVLLDIHRSAPAGIGGSRLVSADRFFPLGTKLFNDLEELAAASVRKEDLLSIDHWAEESIPRETRERLQSLSVFYERFYEAVAARGFSTQSSRFRAVAEGIHPELFPEIDGFLFAGFFSLTKTENRLLRTLLAWEKFSLFLTKGKGIESVLSALGLPVEGLVGRPDASEPGPAIEFTKSPDTHGQIFALNALWKERFSGRRALNDKQVIVLPASETLFPLYEQTLSGLSEEEFNVSLGYPLSRTPISSFFDNLLELSNSVDDEGRIYLPNYLRFVLHPYTKNIFFPGPGKRADLTRILFHAIEEELTGRRRKSFWSLLEIENDEGIRKAVQEKTRNLEGVPDIRTFMDHLQSIHRRLLAPFTEIRNVGDFAGALAGVLEFIYENSTARLHYFFHPYAEAFMDRLEALSRSLLKDVSFDDRRGYFNLFRKVVAAGAVPFYGTPLRGLQVLGFWETRGIRFDDVVILDANEKVIPSFGKGDSLLPPAARAALGLPTYRDNERRMEYYLDTLIRGAKNVHFFFVDNPDKEKSRFVEGLIWAKQKRDGEPRSESYVRTVQYDVALKASGLVPPRKTPAMVEFLRGFTYSATALDAYLACPFRFYASYVLNLREKEEVSEEMEKKEIGVFVHSVLEEYFKKFERKRVRASDLNPEEIGELVDRRFDEEYGGTVAGGAYLMKLQIRRHLEEFISGYQIPLVRELEADKDGLFIIGLEKRTTARRASDGVEYKLVAKTDRTETRGPDLFILDYKTGANEKFLGIRFDKLDPGGRETWGQAVASLQIPFYNLVCSAAMGKPSENVQGLFLMLGKGRLDREIEFSPYHRLDTDVRREQIGIMGRVIDGLLSEIVDPAVPFDPGLARERACEGCPYATLCGRL